MNKDISRHRFTNGKLNLRRFHQAKWDEPVIFELSVPGQRGILVPEVEDGITATVGDPLERLPEKMRRKELPKLPEPLPTPGAAALRAALTREPGSRSEH